jgi:hypothetical protein
MARMALSYGSPNAVFHLYDCPQLWRLLEKSLMNVFRTETPSSPDNDDFAFFSPFQYRTGPDAELSAYFHWHGYLSLGSDSRMRKFHVGHSTTVMDLWA